MDELIREARRFLRVADEVHDFCDVLPEECFYCKARLGFEQALAEAEGVTC